MTKQELAQKLIALQDGDWDPESAHVDADNLLLNYIADEFVTKAFHAIEKWYA